MINGKTGIITILIYYYHYLFATWTLYLLCLNLAYLQLDNSTDHYNYNMPELVNPSNVTNLMLSHLHKETY